MSPSRMVLGISFVYGLHPNDDGRDSRLHQPQQNHGNRLLWFLLFIYFLSKTGHIYHHNIGVVESLC